MPERELLTRLDWDFNIQANVNKVYRAYAREDQIQRERVGWRELQASHRLCSEIAMRALGLRAEDQLYTGAEE